MKGSGTHRTGEIGGVVSRMGMDGAKVNWSEICEREKGVRDRGATDPGGGD